MATLHSNANVFLIAPQLAAIRRTPASCVVSQKKEDLHRTVKRHKRVTRNREEEMGD